MSENWAITIGINEYSFMRSLEYAIKDADAIRQLFLSDQLNFRRIYHFTEQSEPIHQDYGPELDSKPNRANLRRFLRTRFDQSFLREGDNLWFFFAGHGVRYQDRDYLMPSDGDLSDIPNSAIPLHYISERLRRSGADNIILLIDACRNNEGRRSGIGIGQEKQQGVITLFSCSPEESSYEIPELQQGAFTHVLLKSLQLQGEGNCATVERLYEKLRSLVPKLARQYKHGAQTPYGRIEPPTKNHLILLPRQASLTDVMALKIDAFTAEVEHNFATAEQLWIRVLFVSPGDSDGIKAIKRIARSDIPPQSKSQNINLPRQTSGNVSFARNAAVHSQEPEQLVQKISDFSQPTFSDVPQHQIPESFTDYRRTVLRLAYDLNTLKIFSEKLDLKSSIPQINEVLDRVERNTFSVAVVGEFNRGKSTFINALLGQKILPADILPCSATLNRVTYGVKPKVKIIFRDGREKEIDIDALADYVTKLTPEAEEKATNIREAVVYYPVHYCQNGVDIIDTPGLNDEVNMTKVTLSVLPQVDVAIMVILAQAPFSETEREFLESKLLTNDLSRIIFVVTGIDHFKNPDDADRGVKYVKDRIRNMVLKRAREQYGEDSPEYEVYRKKIGDPRVFGLSGYQALEAKLAGDNPKLLAESRFPEFEAAFEKFLTQERSVTFLQIPVNCIIFSASEIIKRISICLEQDRLVTKDVKQELKSMHSEASHILENARYLFRYLIQEGNI